MEGSAEPLFGYLSFYNDEEESEQKVICFKFGEGTHRIGRNDDNKIVVRSSRSISERHAEIKLFRDFKDCARCTLRDLGTLNGLFINGDHFSDPTLTHVLKPGDVIRFGYDRVNFKFSFKPPVAKEAQKELEDTETSPLDLQYVDDLTSGLDKLTEGTGHSGSQLANEQTQKELSATIQTKRISEQGTFSLGGDRLTELRIPPTPTGKSPLSSKSSVAWEIPLKSVSSPTATGDNENHGEQSSGSHSTAGASRQGSSTSRSKGVKEEIQDIRSGSSKWKEEKRSQSEFAGLSLASAVEEELYLAELQLCLMRVNNLLDKHRFQAFYRGFVALKSNVISSNKAKSSWMSYACFARYMIMRLEAKRMAADAIERGSSANHVQDDVLQKVSDKTKLPKSEMDLLQENQAPTHTAVSLHSDEEGELTVGEKGMEIVDKSSLNNFLTVELESGSCRGASESSEQRDTASKSSSSNEQAASRSNQTFVNGPTLHNRGECSTEYFEQGTQTDLELVVEATVRPNLSIAKVTPRLDYNNDAGPHITSYPAPEEVLVTPTDKRHSQKRERTATLESDRAVKTRDTFAASHEFSSLSQSGMDSANSEARGIPSSATPGNVSVDADNIRASDISSSSQVHPRDDVEKELQTANLDILVRKASLAAPKVPHGDSIALGAMENQGEGHSFAEGTPNLEETDTPSTEAHIHELNPPAREVVSGMFTSSTIGTRKASTKGTSGSKSSSTYEEAPPERSPSSAIKLTQPAANIELLSPIGQQRTPKASSPGSLRARNKKAIIDAVGGVGIHRSAEQRQDTAAVSNHVARNGLSKKDAVPSRTPPEESLSYSEPRNSCVDGRSQNGGHNDFRVPALVDILLKMQLLQQLKATSHLLNSVQNSTVSKPADTSSSSYPKDSRRPKGTVRSVKSANHKKTRVSSKAKPKNILSSYASFLRFILILMKVRRENEVTSLSKAGQATAASEERRKVVQFVRHVQRYLSRKHVTIKDLRIVDFRMEGLARVVRGLAPLQHTLYLSTFFHAWSTYHFNQHPQDDTNRLRPVLDSCIRLVLQAKLLGHGPGSQKRRKRSSVLLDRMIESRLDSNVDLRQMKALLTWKQTCLYLKNRDEAAFLCLTKLDSMELSLDTYRMRKAMFKWRRQTKIVCVLTKYVRRYYNNGWVYGFYVLKWNWYRFKSYRFSVLAKVVHRTQHRLGRRALHAFSRYTVADEIKDKCLERSRLAIVYKRRGRMLSRTFRSWSESLVATKENDQSAIRFHRYKSMLKSYARWKLNAKVAKQRRRAKRREMRRLFAKWVAKAEIWQLMARWKVMALKLKRKQYMRTRRKIISVVNARRCSAIKLRSFMKENRRIKLLQYFTLWRDGARSWKFMFLRYTTGKDRQLLRRTFGAWRYYFKIEVPKIRRRIKLAKFRIQRYSFRMWRLWFMERRDNRRRFRSMVRSLVLRKRTKLMRLHLGLWKKQWVLFSALNLVSRIFVKLKRKNKRRALQHWSRATCLIKHKHTIDQMKSLVQKSTAIQAALDELKNQQIAKQEEDKIEGIPDDEEERFEQGGGDEAFYEGGDENLPSQNMRNADGESATEHPKRTDVVAMEKTSTILKKLNDFDLLEKKLLNERRAAQKEIESWSRRLARHGKEKQILEEEVIRIQRNAAREKRELETMIQLYEKRLYKLNKTISDAASFESPIESQQAIALIHGQVGAAIKAEAKARAKYEQLCEAMKNLKNSKKRNQLKSLAKTMELPQRNKNLMNTIASQPVGSGAQAAKNIRDTSLVSDSNH